MAPLCRPPQRCLPTSATQAFKKVTGVSIGHPTPTLVVPNVAIVVAEKRIQCRQTGLSIRSRDA
jgi:hypothetical protein